ALVSTDVGGVSLEASSLDSAIAKQEAWAAAINSSGFVVPPPGSDRAFQETSKLPTPEVCNVVVPDPSSRSQVQPGLALLTTAMRAPWSKMRTLPSCPVGTEHAAGIIMSCRDQRT